MDEKLTSVIDRVKRLALQNPEFDAEIRKVFGNDFADKSSLISEDRINAIYEYCIEEIIHKQATEFYADFPIEQIKPQLINDYCRMETFRRRDNFGDFCLALYQQIECITNWLCTQSNLNDIARIMWAYPAFVKNVRGEHPSLGKRVLKAEATGEDYVVAYLVFGKGIDNDTHIAYAVENSTKNLKDLYAQYKMKAVVYFLGYRAMLINTDFSNYLKITELLCDIYQCRNTNHRGSQRSKNCQAVLDRIIPLKSLYYLVFLGALAQYVNYVKSGINFIPHLQNFVKDLTFKSVQPPIGTKIVKRSLYRKLEENAKT